jgi:hypothetical protein
MRPQTIVPAAGSIPALLTCVYDVCAFYKGSVTSWIRTPHHNAEVKGVPTSKHQSGEACDVIYDGERPRLDAVQMFASHYGVKVVRESNHDHFETV